MEIPGYVQVLCDKNDGSFHSYFTPTSQNTCRVSDKHTARKMAATWPTVDVYVGRFLQSVQITLMKGGADATVVAKSLAVPSHDVIGIKVATGVPPSEAWEIAAAHGRMATIEERK